ncbi:MAG TPA: FAD-dependent oxidoreductase [Pirellulales bacterium]|nr:FAD-dependent oxidoreductase [Pirellulales bacterium]
MAVDTPARIAVLGAGPIGLEAALYARYLGYDVDLYERGRVAENLLRWGHVRLFTPWRMNVSPLGVAALRAQDETWRPPPDDALLTAREFVDIYYRPLAHSDLLADSLRTDTNVTAIGRQGQLKGENVGSDARIFADFRILLRGTSGHELVETADVVIDATGAYGNHCWLGDGGIPAVGESAAAHDIEYGLPDVLGDERETYAGRHTLVIGAGYSAATSIVALAALATESPGTRIVWAARREPTDRDTGPIRLMPNDRLREREQLARAANTLAQSAAIDFRPGTLVSAIERTDSNRLRVQLAGKHAGEIEVDRIIANVGYRPDNTLWSELQVHECYATGGPMKLAAALARQTSADCLDQAAAGAQALINPEPDFYVLGAKSYGRDSRFLLAAGLTQIRELFSIIGDRAELDLYGTMAPTES